MIQRSLPEAVAVAVLEFLTGALIAKPQRVGKPLRADLAGIHSARRGTYRVLHRISEAAGEVVVLRIDHRRDAYRGSRRAVRGVTMSRQREGPTCRVGGAESERGL